MTNRDTADWDPTEILCLFEKSEWLHLKDLYVPKPS